MTSEQHAKAIVNLMVDHLEFHNFDSVRKKLPVEERGRLTYQEMIEAVQGYIKMNKIFKLDE